MLSPLFAIQTNKITEVMKMDIKTLRVSNEVYQLGLTEAELKQLEESLIPQSEGVLILFRKGDKEYGVEYDNNYKGIDNTIFIRDVNKKKDDMAYPCRILREKEFMFNISKEDCESIYYFLKHKASEFPMQNVTAFRSVDEFKLMLKLIMKNNAERRGNDIKYNMNDVDLKHWYWLFDDKMPEKFEITDVHPNIHQIIKVWELDNHRFSLATTSSGDKFKLMAFNNKDQKYNYIDVGRKFTHSTFILDDLPLADIEFDYLKLCAPNQYTFTLVDRTRYNEVVKINKLKIQRQREESEMQTLVKKETEKRFERLSIEPLTIKGITFSNKVISLGDQMITGKISERRTKERYGDKEINVLSFIKENVNLDKINDLDFNDLYNRFCERLDDREFDGTLGSLRVKVERKTKTKSDDTTSSQWKINDVRINKEEIVEMLKRAICFDNVADYNKLLKQVSKCSLLFHDMLNAGLHFVVSANSSFDHETGEKTLKLQVTRLKNHNYIKLGEKNIKIKNTSKIIARSTLNRARRQRYMSLEESIAFFASDIFDPQLDSSDIASIIREGFKEHLLAIKRSEEFLKDAVKNTKAKEAEMMNERGYFVTGISGKQYFLAKSAKVYDVASKSYICIVDKTVGSSFQNDRIVSRLYALYNDSMVARAINTLKVRAE